MIWLCLPLTRRNLITTRISKYDHFSKGEVVISLPSFIGVWANVVLISQLHIENIWFKIYKMKIGGKCTELKPFHLLEEHPRRCSRSHLCN